LVLIGPLGTTDAGIYRLQATGAGLFTAYRFLAS
jgi:hypothetical protein